MMTNRVLKICSLNVKGLEDNMIRGETFRRPKKRQNVSILFLQEVHSSSKTKNIWANEWGYRNIFSYYTGSSSKAGVTILFYNNFEFELLKTYCDPEGRFIISDSNTIDKIKTLANVYAPNKDEPHFFQKVTEYEFHWVSQMEISFSVVISILCRT